MKRLHLLSISTVFMLASCARFSEPPTEGLLPTIAPSLNDVEEPDSPSLQDAIRDQIHPSPIAEKATSMNPDTLPPSVPALDSIPLNQLAQRLSGQGDLSDYSHLPLENRLAFQKAAKEGWAGLAQRTLIPLRAWQTTLQPLPAQRIFYPFGGPDITFVTQLFPEATEYILVGLETPGTRLSALRMFESLERLELLQESMRTFYRKGYFVTHDMAQQLSSKKAVGVAPLILAQLAHLGYKVISLNKLEKTEKFKGKQGLRGLKISFETPEGTAKTLFYVQCRLDNDNKETRQELCSFIQEAPFITALKSASYALHNGRVFSQLRQFLLNSSTAILQDDSGIPYKFLKRTFSVRLFGSYNKPTLAVFEENYQPKLQEDYSVKAEPLPFCLGYGCTQLPSNLFWATRPVSNETPSAEEEAQTP